MSEIEDLSARVEELEGRVSSLEELIHDGDAASEVTGMREFVEKIDPSTHAERSLTIAYYLDQYQRQENFTSKDVEDGYRTCRTQKPTNLSDVLAAIEDKGWAMADGKEGQTRLRRLTTDGLDKIEEVLEDGV